MDRVRDLRNNIGKDFSDNYSSTFRSRLISVSEDGLTCVTEEVAKWDRTPKPGQKVMPSWLTWNAMFY